MAELSVPDPTINSAIAVANWFIAKNQADPSELTNLKLQKILYFAQGWHLAYRDFPLFGDPIEAWTHGPVVRSVYFALGGGKGNAEITEQIKGYVVRGSDYMLGTPEMTFRDADIGDFMESIWGSYSKKEAWELVSISHARGSPWELVSISLKNARAANEAGMYDRYVDPVIPVELMRSYFKSLIAKAS